MKDQRYILAIAVALLTIASSGVSRGQGSKQQKPNVLFIAVDDLRPELGCYGNKIVKSPNIDKLAKSGVLFNQAYCQQAVCSPSRTSIMTGRRPDATKVWDLKTQFRNTIPDVITLPQYFKNNGYHTQSIGKIYHDPAAAQDALSWSVPEILAVTKKEGKYVLPENLRTKSAKAASTEKADVPDNAYVDGQVAEQATEVLRNIKDKPFFLAVGFRRPHLPFSAPKKYWNMYNPEEIIPPAQKGLPKNIPPYAAHKNEELRGYTDIGTDRPITDPKTRELLHAYYAAISYTDAQIGKVLAELDRLNLTKNTIIVLWSDHGFHLGEKGLWAKSTNYEWDTRVPLIISVPGKKHGVRSDALVELVDLYPTLTELGGLGIPAGLEGTALSPLLDQPNQPWKTAAFSQFPRPWLYKGMPELMGYTMRTKRYRYVEWHDFKTGAVKAKELYDRQHDPDEFKNIADLPSNAGLVKQLGEQLNEGWQAARPVAAVSAVTKDQVLQKKYKIPVLKGKENNPVIRLKVQLKDAATLQQIELLTTGTLPLSAIQSLKIFALGPDSALLKTERSERGVLFAEAKAPIREKTILNGNLPLKKGSSYLWITLTLNPDADMSTFLNINASSATLNKGSLKIIPDNYASRLGVALRQHGQDGVHTYRIPGLATANDGTLLGVYDARYDSGRDLQGNIDIGLSRSTDKGKTWLPMQIVLDMGTWGNLPEKFNGVSDANILVDKKTGHIFIAGLWMYGVINDQGKWIEGLNEGSKDWNHQWKTKGSQPGFDVKQTAQFLVVKSTDNGKTWAKPVNLTKMCKQEDWWLWAPAPGQGITLKDGTIVFPTQGRNAKGEAFSNITYSKDGGKTWKTSKAAVAESTTENMAVELTDGTLMLNMRSNKNTTDTSSTNGRAVAITRNLGKDWDLHSSSHNALQEPTCMASIIRHDFEYKGKKRSVLLFSNPDSKTIRKNLSIKISFDDGKTWSDKKILLDEEKSRGYSCLTSIDNNTIGILYESSQADLVFQAIQLDELL
ncbi:arylsulfatase A-like enzyme [Pedobacter africanus]|uniref:Arylsulfatase A-like enzyme n=1 Tax=Pedobacter africanus TaxID=151894 RepID=A0ACC6KSU5_9SPHI|nr:sulfatase-like hydrolase/transferase [Pedobacter africanus]MDR6782176.1 arylsulfatase A-like enzyme [Pedobacter africanus]